MKVDILLYGIARDIIGGSRHEIEMGDEATVGEVMSKLRSNFPDLQKLTSLLIAINDEYAIDTDTINPGDTLVLIPPVSGG
ncbi:MAG: molybdopterin converting factor small subunit [Cyclobacteriaceae bacterium]|jgi:molybdopterin synthase sulfur carrier subunit